MLGKGVRDSTRIYTFILVHNKVVIGYTAEKEYFPLRIIFKEDKISMLTVGYLSMVESIAKNAY